MNDQIKKLMAQATYDVLGVKQVDQQLFAELIVRECAKAADDGMSEVSMRPEWPSYHIKKHFGVEK